jgi:hypothetical protein
VGTPSVTKLAHALRMVLRRVISVVLSECPVMTSKMSKTYESSNEWAAPKHWGSETPSNSVTFGFCPGERNKWAEKKEKEKQRKEREK